MREPQEKKEIFCKRIAASTVFPSAIESDLAVCGRLTSLQSTSSIFDASSSAPSTSSSGGRSSSPASSSSSMLKPSLIMRWMRPANCVDRVDHVKHLDALL